MLNHDKQVKEFYSLVLGRVMNAIREDNLIMQAGVQSSAIEALEEKWRKNLQAARESAANGNSNTLADTVGGHYRGASYGYGAQMAHQHFGLSSIEHGQYSSIQGGLPGQNRHLFPRGVLPAPNMMAQTNQRLRQESHAPGGAIYQEDNDRRPNEQYPIHNFARRREPNGFRFHEGSGPQPMRSILNNTGSDLSTRVSEIPIMRIAPHTPIAPAARQGLGQPMQQGFQGTTGNGLARMGSSMIGGNQNPPMLSMKRTDSTVAVRNEEPLNEIKTSVQESQPVFQLSLSFTQDQAERSEGEERVKDAGDNVKQEAGQSGATLQPIQPAVKLEDEKLPQIKLEDDMSSGDDGDDDDGLFDSDPEEKAQKKKTNPSEMNPSNLGPALDTPGTTAAPTFTAAGISSHDHLGKRDSFSDNDDDADDEDGLFDQDLDEEAPPKIGDKIKKEAGSKKNKQEDRIKVEAPRNLRQEAVQEAIRVHKVELSPSPLGSVANPEKELNSEDDISEDSQFEAGNNSLLGYFTKTKRKKDKRKIIFTKCILRVEGREFIIPNGKGEFKWGAATK